MSTTNGNLIHAVVDVTRPAFEGIEDWEQSKIDETGMLLAAHFLTDQGVDVDDAGDAEHHVILGMKDDDGVYISASVSIRRMLGFDPEECAHGETCPTEKLVELARSNAGGKDILPCGLEITFLSERIANIVLATYPVAA